MSIEDFDSSFRFRNTNKQIKIRIVTPPTTLPIIIGKFALDIESIDNNKLNLKILTILELEILSRAVDETIDVREEIEEFSFVDNVVNVSDAGSERVGVC